MQKTSYIQQPSEIITSLVQSFTPNAVKSAGASFMQNDENIGGNSEQAMLSTESNIGLTNTVQIHTNQATILNPTNGNSVTVSEPTETSFGQDKEENESTVEQNMSPTETNDDFASTAQSDANHPPSAMLQAKMSLSTAQIKPIQLLTTASTVHHDRKNGRPQSEMDKTYQQLEKISNEIRTKFSYINNKWNQFRVWGVPLIVGGLVGIVAASACLWCGYKKHPSITPVFPFSSRN